MSMFGALNRFISRLDGEPQAAPSGSTSGAFGFQVLRNTNSELPIEPWFDFIIGINGRSIDNPDPNLFAAEIRNCAGSSVSLGVWSAKGQKIRSMYAEVPKETPSLGIALQWAPVASTEDVWHILEVAPDSPADLGGLLPFSDYIIGSPEGQLRGPSGLGELIEAYLNKPLRLWVYNHEYDVARAVTITPSRNWGGNGALGCETGYGALHRIPAPLEEPPHGPGETLFDTGDDAANGNTAPSTSEDVAQYLVPANLPMPPPQSAGGSTGANGPPQGHGGRRARPHHAPKAADMDAYFAEGEAKSREEDVPASTKSKGAAPPPPKAGAPPRTSSTPKEDAAGTAEVTEEKAADNDT